MFATTNKTWFTKKRRNSEGGKENGKSRRDGTPVRRGVRALSGFDSFVMCNESALGGLAVVGFKEDVGMLVDACATETEFFGATDVGDNVVEEVKFAVV